jgi:hypothetical protein
MRPIALAFAVLLTCGTVAAQEAPATSTAEAEAPAPDYSDQSLMRLFRPEDPRPPVDRRVTWRLGSVEFRALNMRWKIAFFPFLPPLPGSVPTTNRQMIDPFLLNGTQYATTPRTFQTRRNISAELRRIEKMERDRGKVVATPE